MNLSHATRKPDFFLCKNKGADQLRGRYNCEADQFDRGNCEAFVFAIGIVQFFYFPNLNVQPLTIFCVCTTWFMSDLVENHIVGFLMRQLSKITQLHTVSYVWNISAGTSDNGISQLQSISQKYQHRH